MNLIEAARLNDAEARTYLESLRWPNGPVCPHCKSDDVTRMQGKAHRPGAIQCNACREQFTVTLGTVMESSKIALHKWVLAFHLLCSSKKGFSACQLQRELGLGSYRTAWFMLHRVRHAFSELAGGKLSGTIECDETYVGGKPRFKGKRGVNPSGRGTKKAPVFVLVQRDGSARAKPVPLVDAATLQIEIIKQVEAGSIVLTDEFQSYRGLGRFIGSQHETVHHGSKQYARQSESGMSIHVNTAESFFSLVKRGHYGVYHKMSVKHLAKYCDEFSFRWSRRRQNDSARTEAAIQAAEGKRLMYETPSSPSEGASR
jgi:transposase-like protein